MMMNLLEHNQLYFQLGEKSENRISDEHIILTILEKLEATDLIQFLFVNKSFYSYIKHLIENTQPFENQTFLLKKQWVLNYVPQKISIEYFKQILWRPIVSRELLNILREIDPHIKFSKNKNGEMIFQEEFPRLIQFRDKSYTLKLKTGMILIATINPQEHIMEIKFTNENKESLKLLHIDSNDFEEKCKRDLTKFFLEKLKKIIKTTYEKEIYNLLLNDKKLFEQQCNYTKKRKAILRKSYGSYAERHITREVPSFGYSKIVTTTTILMVTWLVIMTIMATGVIPQLSSLKVPQKLLLTFLPLIPFLGIMLICIRYKYQENQSVHPKNSPLAARIDGEVVAVGNNNRSFFNNSGKANYGCINNSITDIENQISGDDSEKETDENTPLMSHKN